MNLKHGVDNTNIHPSIWYGAGVIESIYRHYGRNLTITSLRDGTHMADSLHYEGKAGDVRTRHLSEKLGNLIYLEMVYTLAPLGFDFKDERATKSHFHFEYDPRNSENWLTFIR